MSFVISYRFHHELSTHVRVAQIEDLNISWFELRRQLEARHCQSRKTNHKNTDMLLAFDFMTNDQLNDSDVIYTNTHLVIKRVPIDFAQRDPTTCQAYNRRGRMVGDMPRKPVENKNG